METHLLFSIPVFESEVNVSDEIVEYSKSLSSNRTLNDNAFISNEMNVLSLEEFKELKEQIGKNVLQFLCDVCKVETNIKVEITSSWVNVHKKGDWAQSHRHMNSVLSGVVYLEVPENSGDIIFESPMQLFGPTLIFKYQSNNILNRDEYLFTPKKNKLYLFPSHLKHSVLQNLSNDDRISLAFNCYLRTQVISEGKTFNL